MSHVPQTVVVKVMLSDSLNFIVRDPHFLVIFFAHFVIKICQMLANENAPIFLKNWAGVL